MKDGQAQSAYRTRSRTEKVIEVPVTIRFGDTDPCGVVYTANG